MLKDVFFNSYECKRKTLIISRSRDYKLPASKMNFSCRLSDDVDDIEETKRRVDLEIAKLRAHDYQGLGKKIFSNLQLGNCSYEIDWLKYPYLAKMSFIFHC